MLILLCALSLTTSVSGQSKISGTVVDASDNYKLEKATVVLLSPEDSILVQFTRTGENGAFMFSGLDTGEYKLIISYPRFADYVENVSVKNDHSDLGVVKLSKATLLLEEVQVTGKIPVVIKGDTIEYDADSFTVEKGANVEDLLKVLPGITVDGSGKITAQGKEVKKVLLDGEEFFGDDPTLITKNIRSDMVNKVQVYEKKSDLAERTGIDDGERTQTIDIQLKDDRKKGMFGQAQGGTGTNSYYSGKIMANRFNGSQKIAAYGIAANDGLVGLGFEDSQKYGVGGNNNVSVTDGGGIMITIDGGGDGTDSWDGQYRSGGVPKALNLGGSYSDKSKDDKHKMNVNYRRNHMNVENTSTYYAQNNLPEVARIDNSLSDTDNETKSNLANLRYDFKLDSLSEITFKLGYSKIERDNHSNSIADQQDLEQNMIYQTESKNNTENRSENINADVLFTKKFKKDRRSLTFNTNFVSGENIGNTNFYSSTQYMHDESVETIDQYKENQAENHSFRSSISYSEPLGQRLSASLGYSFQIDNSMTLDQSFDWNDVTGRYDILDESVLNDFDLSTVKNGINAGINFAGEKLTLNVSNQLNFEDVKRTYNNLHKNLKRDQVSYIPSVSISYRLSKSERLGIRYNGRTVQPLLTQIEPLKQNSQQLIEYLDNPDLSTGFNNSFSIDYNSYKPVSGKSFYIFSYINQHINSISNKVQVDLETGKQQISFVNMDRDNWSGNLHSGYRFPLVKSIGLDMSLGISGNYSNSYNYLSLGEELPLLNNNERYVFAPSFGLNRSKANKLDFSVSLDPGVQILNSSVQPDLNSTTFTMSSYGNFTYYLPKDFKLGVNVRQSYQGATATLRSYSQLNVNSYISKKFLKDKTLETQLFVNDMFNGNNGVNRYQSGHSFIQTGNEVLKRYFMFKLIYNFTTMKGE